MKAFVGQHCETSSAKTDLFTTTLYNRFFFWGGGSLNIKVVFQLNSLICPCDDDIAMRQPVNTMCLN